MQAHPLAADSHVADLPAPAKRGICSAQSGVREMANQGQGSAAGPSTAEGFLADRLAFWSSVTRFMTRVVIALFVLLVLLWWFLV